MSGLKSRDSWKGQARPARVRSATQAATAASHLGRPGGGRPEGRAWDSTVHLQCASSREKHIIITIIIIILIIVIIIVTITMAIIII